MSISLIGSIVQLLALSAQPPTISGTVTDAQTGEAIQRFTLIPGMGTIEGPHFEYVEAMDGEDGEYSWSPQMGSHTLIRIEADGYLPAVAELRDHDETPFNAGLRPAANIEGIILQPDGEPAHEAHVRLAMKRLMVTTINDERPAERPSTPTATTDERGRFVLRPVEEDWRMIVLHDSGCADVSRDSFKPDQPIRLQQWARVSGTLFVGAKPHANGRVGLTRSVTLQELSELQVHRISTAATDETGHFEFTRVTPGKHRIGRWTELGDGKITYSNVRSIVVRAGESIETRLGGVGRPLIGRIKLPTELPEQWRATGHLRAIDGDPASYAFVVAADGTFHVDDVVANRYQLHIELVEITDEFGPPGEALGLAHQAVQLPPMATERSDEPFDIGEVALRAP